MTDLPAHLQGDRRQLGAIAVEGLSAPPVPYISIEGQKFTLVDATGSTMEMPTYGPIFTSRDAQGNEVPVQGSPTGIYLDAVLVDVNAVMSKVYYATAYTPGNTTFMAPDCWSDNGVAPSASAKTPQSEHCQTCQWNVWGSKVNALGNKVKACDDVKKLAWIVPGLNSPMAFLFRLKGSSHRNWSAYVEKVMKQQLGTRALDPTDIVTRLYFEPGQIGIVNFHWVRLIDAQIASFEDQIWKARATDTLVGRLDRPRTAALPAPGAAPGTAISPPVAVAPPPPAPPPVFAQPQSAPHQPAAQPAPSTFGNLSPQAPTQPPPQQNAPAGAPAPQRRQRRQAQPAAAAQPAASAPLPGQITMPGLTPPPTAQPAAPAPQAPPPAPPSFGIQAGAPINAELEAALADALKPLT